MWSDRADEGYLPADRPGLGVTLAAAAVLLLAFASVLAFTYW